MVVTSAGTLTLLKNTITVNGGNGGNGGTSTLNQGGGAPGAGGAAGTGKTTPTGPFIDANAGQKGKAPD